MKDKYAVVGNPVGHSKSPLIHASFAAQTKQNIEYGKIEAGIDDFEACVRRFFAQPGNKGLNVTVPFKERAYAMCEHLSERASLAEAVNTLYLDQKGELHGDNTDGAGLVRDLTVNHGIKLKGLRVLVLGAGGAVKGVLLPVMQQEPAELVVCNRTVIKAEALVSRLQHLGHIRSSAFDALEGSFDVIINGTSASLGGALPAISNSVVCPATVVYDMMYSPDKTVFNQWALDAGAADAIDGLGMLIEQAAEAFMIWRGVRPATHALTVQLRGQ